VLDRVQHLTFNFQSPGDTMFCFILFAIAMFFSSASAKTHAVVVGVDAPALEGISAVASAAYNCVRVSEIINNSDSEARALCAENASRNQVMAAFADAASQASDGETVFFAWFGHGFVIKESGEKGFVPVDWDPEDDTSAIWLERDIKSVMRLRPTVTFRIILDANHRANYRWEKASKELGYVTLHGPTAEDFADLDNVLVISAGSGDNFLNPSDSKFGTAVVAALGARENGVLTIAVFATKLASVYREAGGNPTGVESWMENSSALFTWPAEFAPPPKQALKWRRPVMYAGAGMALAGFGVSSVEWLRTKSLQQRLIDYDYESINGEDGYYDLLDRRDNAFRGSQIGAIAGAVGAVAGGAAFALEWRADHFTSLAPMAGEANGLLFLGRF